MRFLRALTACLAVMLALPPAMSAAQDDASGNWTVRREPSEFTDDTNVSLGLAARDSGICGRAPDNRVMLWIRCRENTTSVLFQTGCHMTSSGRSDYGDVHISLDGHATRVVAMTKWRDDSALGLWRGNDAIPLLRTMLGARTMSVGLKPFDEEAFTAVFDLEGLDVAIAPLREACHW